MTRNFIMTVASAAVIAIGISSAPAKADNNHFFNFVAGATALMIISEAVNDHAHPHRHGHRHVRRVNRRPVHFHGNFRHRHPHRHVHRHPRLRGGYWQR